MNLMRSELIDQLTDTMLGLHTEQPTLVAIDGRSAAGKTTLADELAVHVRSTGRPVLRSSIDQAYQLTVLARKGGFFGIFVWARLRRQLKRRPLAELQRISEPNLPPGKH
jgi:hypothetical protein